MTTDVHAASIGAGIAGPTMALPVERAGIDAEVFEAHDQPADYTGLFLNTASNGLDALRVIGVEVAECADGLPIPRMVMCSGAGKRLGEVTNGVPLSDGRSASVSGVACCRELCGTRPLTGVYRRVRQAPGLVRRHGQRRRGSLRRWHGSVR